MNGAVDRCLPLLLLLLAPLQDPAVHVIRPRSCNITQLEASSSRRGGGRNMAMHRLWDNATNIAPESDTTSTSDDEPGVTQRFGEWRTGRDRWHRPDGSIINRHVNRERLQQQQPDHAVLSTIEEDTDLFSVQGTGIVDGAAVVQIRDYTGDTFLVKSSRGQASLLPDVPTNTSTTAAADDSTSSSSSSSTGFWRHGEFQARQRTAAEQRAHEGGRGAQRMARKQKRVDDWRAGVWKPAWLQRYIVEKRSREQSQEKENQTEEPSAWDGWSMDPSTGWWSYQGTTMASNPPSTSIGGELVDSTSSSSTWTFDDDPPAYSTTGWGVTPSSSSSSQWSASWQSWGDDSALPSTTSSSTSTVLQELPPNFGLYPEVHEVDEDHTWMMSLTNAERAMLQEGGVPARELDRVEQLLASIDDHDSADRGPDARWALGRMVQRIDEGLDTVEKVLQVLLRRLRPRGVWPVVRTQVNQVDQLRLFNWVRNFGDLFPRVLEHHLRVPLQPSEVGDVETRAQPQEQASSSSGPTRTQSTSQLAQTTRTQVDTGNEDHEPAPSSRDGASTSSRHTNEPPGSRSRSRGRASSSSSHIHYDSDGWGLPICLLMPPPTFEGREWLDETPGNTTVAPASMVHVEPDGDPRMVSTFERALRGELLGIWREPDGGVASSTATASSTSTTTTGGEVDELFLVQIPQGMTTLTTTTTLPLSWMDAWSPNASTSTSMGSDCPSAGQVAVFGCSYVGVNSWTTTSTTSTSSTNLRWCPRRICCVMLLVGKPSWGTQRTWWMWPRGC